MDDFSGLVSVIIPFYNAPRLHFAVESILSQTYQNFELLLVDNNSSDGSRQVARRFKSKDDRIQVLTEVRQGVVFAMNTGIERSSGEYIVRMDADDVSYPDRIAVQLELFRSEPSLSVVSGFVDYVGKTENEGFRVYVDWLNEIKTDEEIKRNQFVEFPLVNPSIMFKREVFDQFGSFEEGDFPEDYEFFLRLCSKEVPMGKVNQPVLAWHDSDQRLTRTDPRYSTDAFHRIKSKYLADWLSTNNPHQPHVLIWGQGRVSRKRSDYLREYGVVIQGYIDVVKKAGVIHYEDIPDSKTCFILSYVSNRGAREEIKSYLESKGYEEGVNFILAS